MTDSNYHRFFSWHLKLCNLNYEVILTLKTVCISACVFAMNLYVHVFCKSN